MPYPFSARDTGHLLIEKIFFFRKKPFLMATMTGKNALQKKNTVNVLENNSCHIDDNDDEDDDDQIDIGSRNCLELDVVVFFVHEFQ